MPAEGLKVEKKSRPSVRRVYALDREVKDGQVWDVELFGEVMAVEIVTVRTRNIFFREVGGLRRDFLRTNAEFRADARRLHEGTLETPTGDSQFPIAPAHELGLSLPSDGGGVKKSAAVVAASKAALEKWQEIEAEGRTPQKKEDDRGGWGAQPVPDAAPDAVKVGGDSPEDRAAFLAAELAELITCHSRTMAAIVHHRLAIDEHCQSLTRIMTKIIGRVDELAGLKRPRPRTG